MGTENKMSRKFNKDSIDQLHDYGLHVPTRTIYLGSEEVDIDGGESGVDAKMAERLIKNLHILDNQSSEEITIIMNNPGGETYTGMAIFDAVKKCRSHVTIKGFGNVMSMGSVIFQAADKRVLSAHAVVMIHHGYEGNSNHVKTVRSWVKFGEKYDKIINNIYLTKIREKHLNFTMKRLDKMLDFDTILLPEEAVMFGLADEVEGECIRPIAEDPPKAPEEENK